MAEEDLTSPSGIELFIEDYQFAQDGLLIWSAIISWVEGMRADLLQVPYSRPAESRASNLVGRSPCSQPPGQERRRRVSTAPNRQDLSYILTTMMWTASGLHAAVNFGQFACAGYMQNKPTLMGKLIPFPEATEFVDFLRNPQAYFLTSLPSQVQSTVLIAVVEALSTHSPDEEYLSSEPQQHWLDPGRMVQAFKRFQENVRKAELQIHKRNTHASLRNRNGAGTLPYELLMSSSPAGITRRGIPNSISI